VYKYYRQAFYQPLFWSNIEETCYFSCILFPTFLILIFKYFLLIKNVGKIKERYNAFNLKTKINVFCMYDDLESVGEPALGLLPRLVSLMSVYVPVSFPPGLTTHQV